MAESNPEPGVIEEQRWLPSNGRPLSARLYIPAARQARGAVVLCPGLGFEWVLTHPLLRAVGRECARRGLVALRLDYDGVGESWGDDLDPARVPQWMGSVATAVGALRTAGIPVTALFGARAGALLAMGADLDVPALVAWDPPASGRAYVRWLRSLARLQGYRHLPDAVTVDGITITENTLQELSRLPAVTGWGGRLILAAEGAAATPAGVDVRVVLPDQGGVLGASTLRGLIPDEAVGQVVEALAERADATAVGVAALGTTEVTVGGVRERPATYAEMSATVTEPVDVDAARRGPTLVFLNTYLDPKIGPARGWVTWARELASDGFRSVRVDLTGIGDSPARAGAPSQRPFGPNAVEDIARLASAADVGQGVVLVGSCSGARNAIDAAAHTAVAGVFAVNPALGPPRELLQRLGPGDLRRDDFPDPRATWGHRVARRTPGPA